MIENDASLNYSPISRPTKTGPHSITDEQDPQQNSCRNSVAGSQSREEPVSMLQAFTKRIAPMNLNLERGATVILKFTEVREAD